MIEVPGLTLPHPAEDSAPVRDAKELDEPALKDWLERRPRCCRPTRGTVDGDPLDLVVVGDRASVADGRRVGRVRVDARSAPGGKLRARVPARSQYRYWPVHPLYLRTPAGFRAATRARKPQSAPSPAPVDDNVKFDRATSSIGQVSRDIGVRFTPETWNLTTHRDRSERRRIARLRARQSARVAPRIAPRLPPAASTAPVTSPRHNLTAIPTSPTASAPWPSSLAPALCLSSCSRPPRHLPDSRPILTQPADHAFLPTQSSRPSNSTRARSLTQ